MVRTLSGGIHAYYPAGTDGEQRLWQVSFVHVDFRGDGGYVTAPPPSRIEVDGVIKTYDVIAVTAQGVQPLDAIKLRRFLEPPGRDRKRDDEGWLPWLMVNGQITSKGKRVDYGKTDASIRPVALPDWAAALLRRRKVAQTPNDLDARVHHSQRHLTLPHQHPGPAASHPPPG